MIVKTPSNQPVADADVVIGTTTIATDSYGVAVFSVDPDFSGKAEVSKAGYTGQQVVVSAIGVGSTAVFDTTVKQMILVGEDVDYSTATTGSPVTVGQDDGAAVSITDNNAFVDNNGNPYTAAVDVYITPVDVTDEDDRGAFPGEYNGILEGETEIQDIVSYGMADYTFTDQSGDELQLASGTNASIDIPVFEGGSIGGLDALAAGDELPMWYYDFEAKTWKENEVEKGVITQVTVDGVSKLVLRGSVSHFTPWNADVFPQSGTLVTLFSCGPNHNSANTATASISTGGRQGTFTISNGRDSGPAAVGQACVSITNTIAQALRTTTLSASQSLKARPAPWSSPR